MEEKENKAFSGADVLKFVLKFVIAGVIVGVIVWKNPLKDSSLPAFDAHMFFCLAVAAVLYAFHVFVNAWRWYVLLKAQKIDVSLWSSVMLTMEAFFFSLVMPGGAIGGDVVRAAFTARRMRKGRVFDGVFTILMDRFTGMIAIFSLACVIMPFAWPFIKDAGGVAKALILLLSFGAASGIIASVIVFKHRSLEKFKLYLFLRKIADKISGGMFTKVEEALDTYAKCGKEIFLCVMAGIIGVNVTLGFTMYFVCAGVAGSFGAVEFFPVLAAITIGNIAGLLPLTPSGVGARDYFVVAILSAAAFQGDAAVASLLMTSLILLFNLSGGLFFLFHKHEKA